MANNNKFNIFLLIFTVLFGLSLCVPNVTELDDATYDKFIKENEFTFIMLYAPWCGYCGQFKPIYEEAALKSTQYKFGRVDCTVEGTLCGKLKVNYYPTLTFFKYGHPLHFDGDKTADKLLEWMDIHSKFNGVRLESKEQIEEFRKNNTFHTIGYFSDENSNAFKNFNTAWERRTLYQTPTALVTNPSLFDGRKEGTVDVFNSQSYNPIVLPLDTEISFDSISKLTASIFRNSFPLVQAIDDNNYSRYRQLRKNLYLAWIDLNSSTKGADIKVLAGVANKYPQFSFGYVDFESKKERLYKLGAVKTHVNTIVRIDFQSEDSYIYELPNKHNVQEISNWIDGIISGKIQPNILSEEIPEKQDGPVTKIVGLNFDEIVMDSTKDVFVNTISTGARDASTTPPSTRWEKFSRV